MDYRTVDEAIQRGMGSIQTLENIYGRDFVERYGGVKINQDLATGPIGEGLRKFSEEKGCDVFADMKIAHGSSTGERIMRRLSDHLPFDYVTVSAVLGGDILKKYVEASAEHDARVIAWTVHTKTSPEDVERMYGQSVSDVIYTLAQIAEDAGCDAAVMEAGRLKEQRIRNLPIRKLVTGIRIDPSDRGEQRRVSALDELSQYRSDVDYVVISSRYLGDPKSLKKIMDSLIVEG